MRDMVERVARAIAVEYGWYEDPLHHHRALARAAMAAMQEVLDARIDGVIDRAVRAADEARDVWIDELRSVLKD